MMKSEKVEKFMQLAGVKSVEDLQACSPKMRLLGAQLLLSETLEYVVKGLGVVPSYNGQSIEQPDGLDYSLAEASAPDKIEMLDGLADVAYTMFWNAIAFNLPLEAAYDLVCDNNLEKFVPLEENAEAETTDIEKSAWHCNKSVEWPKEVVKVSKLKVHGKWYAVGTDANGKVRKPSTYAPVDLKEIAAQTR